MNLMSSAVTLRPFSVRSRFSRRMRRQYGRFWVSQTCLSTESRRKISYSLPPTRNLERLPNVFITAPYSLDCNALLPVPKVCFLGTYGAGGHNSGSSISIRENAEQPDDGPRSKSATHGLIHQQQVQRDDNAN